MKRFVVFLLIFVLMMTIYPSFNKSSAEIKFIHPGLTINKEQLDYAKQKVLDGEKPWIDGYEMIKKIRAFHPTQSGGDITETFGDPDAQILDWEPHPVEYYRDGPHHDDPYDMNRRYLETDGQIAYACALLWYFDEDEAYAQKVVEILNAWAYTLKEIDDEEDGSLSTCFGWPNMVLAAEVIRTTYDGWSQADQDKFKELLSTEVLDATWKTYDKTWPCRNNQNCYGHFLITCIAVYTEDEELFNKMMVETPKLLTHYIFDPEGQCLESTRDLSHVQNGLTALAGTCEIAWNHGIDMYSHEDNRLLKGIEWHTPYIMRFDDADYSMQDKLLSESYGDDESLKTPRGKPHYYYELVYHHYHDRMGLETPNIERALANEGNAKYPIRPEGAHRIGGYGTLLYYQDPNPLPTPEPTLPPTLEPTPTPTLQPTTAPTITPSVPVLQPTIEPTSSPNLTIIMVINEPCMLVNNVMKEIDPGRGTVPVIVNDRTLLPIRSLIENLGGTIQWDGSEKRVDIMMDDKVIKMWIGNTFMSVNDEPFVNDVAPQIINDRTYLPLRFIIESFNYKVDWDGETKAVTITA